MDQKAIEAKRAGAEYLRKLQGLGKPDRSSSVALLDKIKEAAKKGIKYIPEPGKLGALSGVLGVASLLKSGDMLAATPIGASTSAGPAEGSPDAALESGHPQSWGEQFKAMQEMEKQRIQENPNVNVVAANSPVDQLAQPIPSEGEQETLKARMAALIGMR